MLYCNKGSNGAVGFNTYGAFLFSTVILNTGPLAKRGGSLGSGSSEGAAGLLPAVLFLFWG
jgi:hypothetical protein